PSNSSNSSFSIQSTPIALPRPVAGTAARLIRALQECNISDAAWLPCRSVLPVRGVTVLARMVLAAIAAIMGAVAVVARTAMTALLLAPMRSTAVAGLCRLRGRMAPRLACTPVRGGDGHADQPLDVTQIGPLFVIAERNRHAFGPGARGTANTVDITLRNVR